ncbi:MAG: CPBP family glutamic-type intramembrane protease [Marinibacterium sp.]
MDPITERPDKVSNANGDKRPAGWAALDSFVAQARPACEVWRLIVGVILIAMTGIAMNTSVAGFLRSVAPEFWRQNITAPDLPGQSPAALLILLGSFGFFTLGVALTVRILHNRAPVTVIGPPRVALAQIRAVLIMIVLVALVTAILPPYSTSLEGELNPNLSPGKWAALLPLSLVAVLIQASAEEILFRGYLQQQLAARFSSPLIWAGIPSLLFALGHYAPQDAGENTWLVILWAAVFGLLMADLTARAGTLGPAIAIHFANNVSALVYFSASESMNGLALFVSPAAAADPALVRAWLPVDFASMVVAWLAARLVLRR